MIRVCYYRGCGVVFGLILLILIILLLLGRI